MAAYAYPTLGDISSLYGHQDQRQPQSDQSNNTYLNFMAAHVQNNMNKQHQNSSLAHNRSFHPIDGILYSPTDDCVQFPVPQTDESSGPQTFFNASPLMSTLERQDGSTSSPASRSSNESPHHDHIDVDGWQLLPEAKRTKPADADIKSACWTSPLCPSYGKAGPHALPSACGDGCAPNTFDEKAMDQWLLDFAKANNDTGAIDRPSTTLMLDPLNRTSDAVSMSFPELKSIKNEELEEFIDGPTASSRSKKRPSRRMSSESPLSPDPLQVPAVKATFAKPSRRQPHNEIEKKYRESINTHLEALKDSVPAFQRSKSSQCTQGKMDIEDLAAAPKPSKSIILASAVAHIKKIEKEKRQLEQERTLLRQEVRALQAMVKAGCDDCSVISYVNGLNGLNLGLDNSGRGMERIA